LLLGDPKTNPTSSSKELESIGKTWGEAEKIAINRVRWKAMVEALCLPRGKED